VEQFLAIFQEALGAIREARFFATERGYQGELIAELRQRLHQADFPGDPVIEQEYQETLPNHGIAIRPDLIIHIPFDRKVTEKRSQGNFVAVEIKRRASPAEAAEDFESLVAMKEQLNYPITIFLNLDAAETYASRCPVSIASQTSVSRFSFAMTRQLFGWPGASDSGRRVRYRAARCASHEDSGSVPERTRTNTNARIPNRRKWRGKSTSPFSPSLLWGAHPRGKGQAASRCANGAALTAAMSGERSPGLGGAAGIRVPSGRPQSGTTEGVHG
jgi:hypothetical protein